MNQISIGFMGAGGIARAHAYSLNALKFYYPEIPEISFEAVTSARKESRESFAKNFGFRHSPDMAEFIRQRNINTILILGPNEVHYEHLKLSLEMTGVKNIYLEKPVCSSRDEELRMADLLKEIPAGINIQVGFQYLQSAAVREALKFWHTGKLGKPIHFGLKYYHGDYLQVSYREKRRTRLTPAPDGGAMADLGSHGISLVMAFLGENIEILHALQAGGYSDVPMDSDLFSSLSLVDPVSLAVGTLSASRISSGTGDLIDLEIFAEKGSLRYSSQHADFFEYYLEEDQHWVRQLVGSHYKPASSFPSGHVPAGWLRAMVHAHYIFLTGRHEGSYVPGLEHGLAVQRIVRKTAEHLDEFRKNLQRDR
ncbi:MAG: Gfo/Idh/MocA family oxidoreductase [Cyclobacteriaceae bacterium]|nr:Gfo/Idh/MocA family oxidoreductase [Cyclobacteriaceae bacterium]